MSKQDLKALFSGVGMAAVAGMLMGAAMRPDLNEGDRPEGPQILAGWSAARSTGPFDDGMTLAYAQGQIPDYVVGTDWKKQIAWADTSEAPVDARPVMDREDAAPAAQQHAALMVYEEPSREGAAFPSMAGGATYESNRPAPPPPPAAAPAERTFDPDVAPEATGDTSPAQG